MTVRSPEEYERNREMQRARNQRQRETPEKRALYNQRNRETHARYPEKNRARSQLNYAVAKGQITKPTVCEDCQQTFPLRQIQGAHKDYSKPYDVRWLCARCHGVFDRGSRPHYMKRTA